MALLGPTEPRVERKPFTISTPQTSMTTNIDCEPGMYSVHVAASAISGVGATVRPQIKVRRFTNKEQSRTEVLFLQRLTIVTQVTVLSLSTTADAVAVPTFKIAATLPVVPAPPIPVPFGLQIQYVTNAATFSSPPDYTGEVLMCRRV